MKGKIDYDYVTTQYAHIYLQLLSLWEMYVCIGLMMFINWDRRHDCGANNKTKYTSDLLKKKQ